MRTKNIILFSNILVTLFSLFLCGNTSAAMFTVKSPSPIIGAPGSSHTVSITVPTFDDIDYVDILLTYLDVSPSPSFGSFTEIGKIETRILKNTGPTTINIGTFKFFDIARPGESGNQGWRIYTSEGDRGSSFAVEVAPIPIPATGWLMGSALVGLLGFSSRRKTRSE